MARIGVALHNIKQRKNKKEKLALRIPIMLSVAATRRITSLSVLMGTPALSVLPIGFQRAASSHSSDSRKVFAHVFGFPLGNSRRFPGSHYSWVATQLSTIICNEHQVLPDSLEYSCSSGLIATFLFCKNCPNCSSAA
jgi:hypothetical protein